MLPPSLKKSYTLTKACKEFRLQLSCFSFARSPGSPLSIEVSLCTSTRPPSPTDRCSDFCSALAVISFCFLNTRFPSLPLFARLPSAFSYFAPSTESCIKLFPEDWLNYMHDFLPSTTRRKQRNNHMCLTLLLIYEPMPSLPFCGITTIMPREEWKGLSLQSSESLSGPFLGEKKAALAKTAHVPAGKHLVVLGGFFCFDFKEESIYSSHSNGQRYFNKLSSASRCFSPKSDNKTFGFHRISIGVFNSKDILC